MMHLRLNHPIVHVQAILSACHHLELPKPAEMLRTDGLFQAAFRADLRDTQLSRLQRIENHQAFPVPEQLDDFGGSLEDTPVHSAEQHGALAFHAAPTKASS